MRLAHLDTTLDVAIRSKNIKEENNNYMYLK